LPLALGERKWQKKVKKSSFIEIFFSSMLAKDVGLLYVGGLNTPFGEIKVTKTLRQLNKKIIECSWDHQVAAP
jgi:hypothetical protein